MKQQNSDQSPQRSAQDLAAAADDLAVAILQDRIEDAQKRRDDHNRQLTADDLARLGQQGALN